MTDQTRPMDAERLAEWDDVMVSLAENAPNDVALWWPEEIRKLGRIARAQHAEVTRLAAERDALKRAAVEEEDRWIDWLNQFDALMDDTWDGDESMDAIVFKWAEHTAADLAHLRAVIEEARALAVSDHDMDTRQELAVQFLAILDRGLKGAGE